MRVNSIFGGFLELTVADSKRHLVHPWFNCDSTAESAAFLGKVVTHILKSVSFFFVNWKFSFDMIFKNHMA